MINRTKPKNFRYEEYIELKQILRESKFSKINPQIIKEIVLPILIQQIKMLGYHSLTPYKISEMMKSEKLENENIDPFPVENNRVFNRNQPIKLREEKPFSRLDIIVAILNSVEALMAQEILNNMP